MDFGEFYNLTPAARMLRRGTTAARPFHEDWVNQQLTDVCDYVAHNPWVRGAFGENLHVSVQVAKDGSSLLLMFTKV